jgi:methionine-gamma-lyase
MTMASDGTSRHGDVRAETAVLTRGFDPHLSVGSARPAVFRSSTFVFSSPEAAERAFAISGGRARADEGESVDLIYSRMNHPNAEILEDQIVPLEPGASAAAVFNSGMAAISTLFFLLCPPGSTIVHTTPLYGGTQSLLDGLLASLGVKSVGVDAGDTAGLRKAIADAEKLRLVFVETPANPTLRMADIGAAVETAAARKGEPVLVAVDNTLMGPAFQHPIALGADLAVYSGTKYLSGFSDMLAGVIIGRDVELIGKLRRMRSSLGNILQPDECWLLDSRLPTVALRMNQQSKTAKRVAESLVGHPAVERIYYPTMFEDPEQIRIRDAQCAYPGAMFSIDVRGGKAGAFEFLRSLRIARGAVSLGGVETLACHPATTTHSGAPPDDLARIGVTDSLVRVSVGIEDWRDLLQDFQQALDHAARLTLAPT